MMLIINTESGSDFIDPQFLLSLTPGSSSNSSRNWRTMWQEVDSRYIHILIFSTEAWIHDILKTKRELRRRWLTENLDGFNRWFQDDEDSVRKKKKERQKERKWLLSLTDPNMMFWSVFWPERRSTASAGLLAQVGRTSRTGCGTRRVATWRSSRSIPVGWRRWRRRLWLGFLWKWNSDDDLTRPPWLVSVFNLSHLRSCWWTGPQLQRGRESETWAGRGRRCAAGPGYLRLRSRVAWG